ncbi:hypothetical protein ACJDU8_22820 [Clostridium sp. WILCCON 0269]|uniref:Uncharacterized protein n=1 Tax=Candidatus Clostridium eludens TaxID=3381663 RepID=A0ABW8SR13_9CLOT
MGNKHVVKSQIIKDKKNKIGKIFSDLGKDLNLEKFVKNFKENYPEDWDSIVKRYKDHKRLSKKGKKYPMPEPDKYLENIYNNYINAVNQE